MPVNVYALIPLHYDKFHVTLAYPCIFLCCFCYVFSFYDDHLVVGVDEREVRDGSRRRSGAA